MFLLFHLLVPFIIVESYCRIFHKSYNRFFLVIGSLFADFDKILSILQISSGRGYFHTILVNSIIFILIYFSFKNQPEKYLSFIFGGIMHLCLDLPAIPLFYPFIQYDFSPTHYNIFEYTNYFIQIFLHSEKVFYTELVGGMIFGSYTVITKFRGIKWK